MRSVALIPFVMSISIPGLSWKRTFFIPVSGDFVPLLPLATAPPREVGEEQEQCALGVGWKVVRFWSCGRFGQANLIGSPSTSGMPGTW